MINEPKKNTESDSIMRKNRSVKTDMLLNMAAHSQAPYPEFLT